MNDFFLFMFYMEKMKDYYEQLKYFIEKYNKISNNYYEVNFKTFGYYHKEPEFFGIIIEIFKKTNHKNTMFQIIYRNDRKNDDLILAHVPTLCENVFLEKMDESNLFEIFKIIERLESKDFQILMMEKGDSVFLLDDKHLKLEKEYNDLRKMGKEKMKNFSK